VNNSFAALEDVRLEQGPRTDPEETAALNSPNRTCRGATPKTLADPTAPRLAARYARLANARGGALPGKENLSRAKLRNSGRQNWSWLTTRRGLSSKPHAPLTKRRAAGLERNRAIHYCGICMLRREVGGNRNMGRTRHRFEGMVPFTGSFSSSFAGSSPAPALSGANDLRQHTGAVWPFSLRRTFGKLLF